MIKLNTFSGRRKNPKKIADWQQAISDSRCSMKIDDLLKQAEQQLLVRALLTEKAIDVGVTKRVFTFHIFSGTTEPVDGYSWFEVEYSSVELLLTGGDYTAGEDGYRLLPPRGVKEDEARTILQEMTDDWSKIISSKEIITQPFHFFDLIKNKSCPPENINAVLHLSVLFGIYCEKKYYNKYPDLSLRLKALLYQSRKKFFACFN